MLDAHGFKHGVAAAINGKAHGDSLQLITTASSRALLGV
jgi:hypothetical protein